MCMGKTVVAVFFVLLILLAEIAGINSAGSTLRICSFGASQISSSGWPMFHHDLRHSGYTALHAPKTSVLRWRYETGDFVYSSPAVVDGLVIAGSDDGSVYAVEEMSGTMVWNFTTSGKVRSSPAVVDGMVFVGSYDDSVYALSEVTGEKIWSYKTGDSIACSPAVADGIVFVGSSDGYLYALNESSGQRFWKSSLSLGDSWSSPAVADGMVFIGNSGGSFWALDENTGRITWNYDADGIGETSPAVSGGMVFVAATQVISALNESTGTVIWSSSIPTYVFCSPAVADGAVFIGAYPTGMYAYNMTTGTLIWTTYSIESGSDFSSPAVADGMVFYGTFGSEVLAVNASTGERIWNYSAPYGWVIMSSPAIADNMLFIGVGGYICCFGENVNVKPVLQVATPSDNATVSSPDVSLSWNCNSIIAIDHYAVKLDNGQWISVGQNRAYTFEGLTNGNHTIYVQAIDRGGLSSTVYVDFEVNVFPAVIILIVGIVLAASIGAALVYFTTRRKNKRTVERNMRSPQEAARVLSMAMLSYETVDATDE